MYIYKYKYIYIYMMCMCMYMCMYVYIQYILKSIEMWMCYGKMIYQWFLNSPQTHIKNHIN